MRAVVQRVLEACVESDHGQSSIGHGLLIYLGVGVEDTEEDAARLAEKARHLRVFSDAAGKMNRDVAQVGGAVLTVSAFTVQADARHGRRPSFEGAAAPPRARTLYESFCGHLERHGVVVRQGCFGELMQVRSVNDGPICLLLDSRRVF